MRYEPRVPDESVNVSDVSPVRELGRLAGSLLAGLVVLGVLIAFSVDIAVRLIPRDFETRAFADLQFADPGDPGRPDPRRASVRGLVQRLTAHWKGAPYAFRVSITDSPELNAGAFPGGAIMVTSGLLAEVRSENELAFVLGHELGHFQGRHHLRRLGRTVLYGLAASAVLGQAGSAAQTGSLVTSLTERGFDRSQEEEADSFGLDLLNAEYGHVQEAGAFFTRVSKSGGGTRFLAYLSTHPAPADRADRLVRLAESRGYAPRGTLTSYSIGKAAETP